MPETETLLDALRAIVGADHVLTDAENRAFFSRDLFFTGDDALAVIQPGTREELAAAVKTATRAGHAVIARGGGLSYTKGYVPAVPDAIMVDMRRLNRVLDVSPANMTVTAECGCTWEAVYKATAAHGLRPAHFGPTTGRYSTLGGGLSFASMFFNSARAGTAADAVLGLEVVLADGRRVTTGSGAIRGGVPFFRNFGPDLAGLFLNDAGALGIKAAATLRLEPIPAGSAFASFGFADYHAMIAAALAVGRTGLASECLGVAAHPVPTAAGPGQPALHVVVEGATPALAAGNLACVVAAIGPQAEQRDGAVPAFIRRDPFGFLAGPLDPQGRRQIWTHGIFAYDRAGPGYSATAALLDRHGPALRDHGIGVTVSTAIAATAALIEPVLTWSDAVTPLHLRGMAPQATPSATPNAAARAVVDQLRNELRDLYAQLGAAHLQVGKFYAFSETVAPETQALLNALKITLDPDNKFNPGALGLTP